MKLSELLKSTNVIQTVGNTDIDITGISYDSRRIKHGNIFVAIPGFVCDGYSFIPDAVKNGAVAVVMERDSKDSYCATRIFVENGRAAMADISNGFYDYPSNKLKLVGVTGTNGKTTTTFLIESIFRSGGFKTGLIGTVGAHIDRKLIHPTLTTPESVDLQRILCDMKSIGVTHVAIEVSSHSISLERVRGADFDVVIHTNITHDHLDFHKNMENYVNSKLELFKNLGGFKKKNVWAVINNDDDYAQFLIKNCNGRVVTYGMDANADLCAKAVKSNLSGMKFDVLHGRNKFKIETKLIGMHNIYNILAAVSCGSVMRFDISKIIEGIAKLEGVPGRLERIDCGQKFDVFVDFAHSPDGMEKLLDTLKCLTKKKVILLFGCTGDRDKLKRPIMGEIASRKSDYAIITTDDPHNEDPLKIIDEVETGVKRQGWVEGKNYFKIVDRRDAIKRALDLASPGDCVVLAGRGHETYQDFLGKKVEIDDREVARSILGGGCK